MTNLSALKVIECKYCYAGWEAFIEEQHEAFVSSIKEFSKRREVDLYHEYDLYRNAGVPYSIHSINYKDTSIAPYAAITKAFSDIVFESISQNEGVLIAGGYCNYAPAILGGLQRAIGQDKAIGVIWIDAHSDNQIVEDFDTPIQLVGVPVTTFLGQTLPDYRKNICGLLAPIQGKNVIISDARITLPDEEENMKAAEVIRLTEKEFEDTAKWEQTVSELAMRTDSIYLAVDIDILKPEYIPAYEVPTPGGHDIDIVAQNIAAVMRTGKVDVFSVSCVNFDHYENGGERTFQSGMKLIETGLKNWKEKGIFL